MLIRLLPIHALVIGTDAVRTLSDTDINSPKFSCFTKMSAVSAVSCTGFCFNAVRSCCVGFVNASHNPFLGLYVLMDSPGSVGARGLAP